MIRKEGHDAKHQVKLHFLITPDPYIFTAKFFFEPAVESLRHRPLVIRNGHLTIMDRGRSQNHTDRKPTVIDIGMKLKTDPGFKVTLSVFLGPHVATYGNLLQRFLGLLGHLADQTTLRLGLAGFCPARGASLVRNRLVL